MGVNFVVLVSGFGHINISSLIRSEATLGASEFGSKVI